MKVLILSPHTDDAELAMGGTIVKLVENSSDLTVLTFSAVGRKQLREECERTLKVLGVENVEIHDFPVRQFPQHRQVILEILYRYNQEHEPDVVFTPSTSDLHQDHQVVTNEAMRAFKRSTLLGYFNYWNNIIYRENCFVSLGEKHVKKKVKALMNYKSQMPRHYFDEEYIVSLMRARGGQISEKYAESFEVIKLIFKNPLEIREIET